MEFNLAQIHEAVEATVPDRLCIVRADRTFTYAEIGRILGVSESSLQTLFTRGGAKKRDGFDDSEPPPRRGAPAAKPAAPETRRAESAPAKPNALPGMLE